MTDVAGVLCLAPNLDGTKCTRHRTPGEDTCWWHHPDKVEERAQRLEAQAAALRSTIGAQAQ